MDTISQELETERTPAMASKQRNLNLTKVFAWRRNVPFVGLHLSCLGHNNYHHYQSSANQGYFWWEIDVSYYLIRLIGFTGMVWDIRKPAPHVLAANTEQAGPRPEAS